MVLNKMSQELKDKEIFEKAKEYAYRYIDEIDSRDVFPSEENQKLLSHFDEPMPVRSSDGLQVIDFLEKYGSINTASQIGSRYFGFVNGSAVPAALAVKWLADVWDQNGGLYYTSPINAKLESVCESWIKEIFDLPKETVAGFVSGTSSANLCCLIAARQHILNNLNWNLSEKGLNGAPQIRIIAHRQVHASIKKTLAILGYGKNNIEWINSDDQGRIIVDELPTLDNSCLVLLQAGNANTGAFDEFDSICDQAINAGAWVHIDGAFGLWAGASQKLKHLTKGMQKASSWAVDGHKTLNTPYDSGIALCRYPDSMITGLQATGEYIVMSDQREPILYTQEMSKRARAIELWATMKFLGKTGIEEMVDNMHERSLQLAEGLQELGLHLLNEVVFNQVLVRHESDELTDQITAYLQSSGVLWLGGTTWLGKRAIRNSLCSWATTEEDITRTLQVYKQALSKL